MDWVAIGSRIRKHREQFGFTRETFAEKLDVTPKFCADIELGNKGMSVQTLCKISDILKLSTDYILFWVSQGDSPLSSIDFKRCTPAEQKYAEVFCEPLLQLWKVKETEAAVISSNLTYILSS